MDRLDYSVIRSRLVVERAFASEFVRVELPRMLSDMWVKAYIDAFPGAEVVAIQLKTFEYLFDLTAKRNVAAFGVMPEANKAHRDRTRIAGHPKPEGMEYHRGHMIPHSGHGREDINIFSQLASINVGRFRELERRAVANPGSFYFVRLLYLSGSQSQRPAAVEQGLLLNVDPPMFDILTFPN